MPPKFPNQDVPSDNVYVTAETQVVVDARPTRVFAENLAKFKECCLANKVDWKEAKFIKSKMDLIGLHPKKHRILFWGNWEKNKKYCGNGWDARLAYLLYMSDIRQTHDGIVDDGSLTLSAHMDNVLHNMEVSEAESVKEEEEGDDGEG